MPTNSKTILITGGAGFIGSHAAKLFAKQGYKLILVDNLNKYYDVKLKFGRLKVFLKDTPFKFYKIDINQRTALRKIFVRHRIDVICHLAAQAGVRYSLTNPFVYESSNVAGTLNLLELAKEFKVKSFIVASSSSVYGNSGKQPFKESQMTDEPISIYAATKKATELLAYTYHHLYGINCTCLRFFTVYGPWGRPDMAIFKFAKSIVDGRQIEVYNYGNMKRDFTYVDDIVRGISQAIKKNYPWEIMNLSAGRPVALGKFISLLEKAFGKKAQKNFLPIQPGDVLSTYGDSQKAKKLLGYRPKTSIEQGVKKFAKWYKEYYK